MESGVYKLSKTVKQIISAEDLANGKFIQCVRGLLNRKESWSTSLLKNLKQNIFICVEPNKTDGDLDENVIKFIGLTEYPIYHYNEDKKVKSKQLNVKLPGNIVAASFKRLKEKEEMMEELNISIEAGLSSNQRDFSLLTDGTGVKERKISEFPLRKMEAIRKRTLTRSKVSFGPMLHMPEVVEAAMTNSFGMKVELNDMKDELDSITKNEETFAAKLCGIEAKQNSIEAKLDRLLAFQIKILGDDSAA